MRIARIWIAALSIPTGLEVYAQPVFVPDTNLRNAINSQVPGAVDVNGYIDPANPVVVATTDLNLYIAWSPADLAGLTAFTELEGLNVMSAGTVVLSVPAWPDSLKELMVYPQYVASSLPAFPSSLTDLFLSGILGLTYLPALPPGLAALNLNYLPDLVGVGALPPALSTLAFSSLYSLGGIASFPAAPSSIYLFNMPGLFSLPPFPTTIDSALYLVDLSNLQYLPQFPDSCPGISLTALPVGILPNFPRDLSSLSIIDLPNLPCLPVLPNSVAYVNVNGSGITCLPNLPVSCAAYDWNGITLPPAPSLLCTALNSSCPPAAAGVSGTVYLDANANGLRDPGEAPYPMAGIALVPGPFLGGVTADGGYHYGVMPGSYTLTCIPTGSYVQSVSPVSHTAAPAAITDVDTLNDFGVVLIPGMQDLSMHASEMLPPVPGDTNAISMCISNTGTVPMSDTIFLAYPVQQSLAWASQPPDVVAMGSAGWAFNALLPGGSHCIQVRFTTDVATPIGTLLTLTATAGPVSSDQTPLDNVHVLMIDVVGSYDPNDKQVDPQSMTQADVQAGGELGYLIRFQNTGNWPASRVVITDTLSADLDWSSFEFLASSHDCSWYVQDGIAHFTFDPIYLPDSALDEVGSHGFVEFSIAPVATLPDGAVVPNAANIYFDHNAPVITDAALFSVDNSVDVLPLGTSDIRLWPNPAGSVLNIALPEHMGPQDYVVLDATGRPVLSGYGRGPFIPLDVSALSSGPYRMTITGRWGHRQIIAFVKQ